VLFDSLPLGQTILNYPSASKKVPKKASLQLHLGESRLPDESRFGSTQRPGPFRSFTRTKHYAFAEDGVNIFKPNHQAELKGAMCMLPRPLTNAITALLLIALSLSAPAQTPAPQSQKTKEQKQEGGSLLRLETELVQIDAVVHDSKGNLVRDLKREDFELFEDGKPQQITHFAVGTASRSAVWVGTAPPKTAKSAAASSTSVETSIGRYLVLAVDDVNLAPENLLLAKRVLLRFIEQQMISGDQVAVVTTSGSIGLFQQFTTERAVLQRAINRLGVHQRTGASPFDNPYISDYQAELIDMGDPDALELAIQEILRQEPPPPSPTGGAQQAAGRAGGVGAGAQTGPAASARSRAAARAQSQARSIVAQNANTVSATLSTLEGIVRTLRELAGRKILVLLSDGFFMGGSRFSKHYDLRRVTDAATRAGVVIYSIDARGLIATSGEGDASQPSSARAGVPELPGVRGRIEHSAIEAKRDGLNALARDTGGFLVFNTNDLNLGMKRVMEDNETYYVLAYEPSTSYRDGRFRQIEVRVKGQPNLTARTRKGYFAPNEKEVIAQKAAEKSKEKSPEKAAREAQAAKESQFRAGIGSLFPLRGIPMALAADYVDSAEFGPVAVINSHINASGLNFEQVNGQYRTTLELVGLIFDEKGKVAGNFNERLNVSLKQASYEQAIKNGFNYRRIAPLKPGFYQVRLAIREEGTAQLGSAAQWVEVSDLSKKQLTLSGVFLSAAKEDLGESLTPVSKPGESVTPYQPSPAKASRRFKRDSSMDFLLMAYNAKVDDKGSTDLVVQSQVFAGSKLIYASPLSKIETAGGQDARHAPYAARLSLAAFEPGEYELRLLVIDRTAKTTANRRVNFTVE
jgi:VWFA-related protein